MKRNFGITPENKYTFHGFEASPSSYSLDSRFFRKSVYYKVMRYLQEMHVKYKDKEGLKVSNGKMF